MDSAACWVLRCCNKEELFFSVMKSPVILPLWAAVCDFSPKAECVPTFARESERGAFVPEVLKTVWTMCWKRWYDVVSAPFTAFSRMKKKAGERHWRFSRQCLFTAARSAGCYGGLRVLEIDTFFETPGTV